MAQKDHIVKRKKIFQAGVIDVQTRQNATINIIEKIALIIILQRKSFLSKESFEFFSDLSEFSNFIFDVGLYNCFFSFIFINLKYFIFSI